MNPYLQEVVDAHVLIERWLSQGEGSAEALMSRFAAEFTMIPLNGEKMDYPTVSRFFHQAGAGRPELHIVVDQAKIISEWHDGAAVLYRERQTLADGSENVRWSTAIFQQAEGKIVWRHLQETRLG
ncbi:DUF4440 domain-containing protein [Klebsiella quasipneumoniae subsp. quasipneumoniae]|uniref:DUF4440 domain-containing protein n=1 Tax=Klebsiella quasipneumoniae TaxID=1463165 RepID=UPI00200FB061|nr:DUF4440 domain-containing protein [Klebsiella quasipneumoniae]MCL1442628.1 DUF4440 domain-containing protein [Klebsiella quasipneumoniae]